jgi:hypothetical protein
MTARKGSEYRAMPIFCVRGVTFMNSYAEASSDLIASSVT